MTSHLIVVKDTGLLGRKLLLSHNLKTNSSRIGTEAVVRDSKHSAHSLMLEGIYHRSDQCTFDNNLEIQNDFT